LTATRAKLSKMKIIAEIVPVPLARTKINTVNKGRFLTSRSQQFKQDLGFIARAAMQGRDIFTGALKLTINLYRNVKTTAKLFGDADNHAKAVLDACNGIVFFDDAQIVDLQVIKHYSKIQYLVIDVEVIENVD